ncbi:cellulose biosynthesis cyclic di-GMP-binding regulatory protein BcsB [Pseudomonas fragi]|uniref:cellulose biosynthesis cyclic di-GMP-binding regulatory protein BcsB n=1 Tax=Pseudomonas fragi TaxID=296 RepID=UPI001475E3F0|nr:cellulose biosynthesis cyclic di-GMP-binding regulatory protein BcsB [Pseudomonas fragi]NNA84426.1 cellulose biosynthesis cyclic di-GMP-binding regulatory protein BcsB [Pseudomonas fragi]NNB09936.1 cellulose biosynthesis cyclic di-GMP-binding regulatory protein BcsB [Pseudomonas fragi]NNB37626.1 cellulose biosynthesis cyclic di-GMP-binding regulatory protein BcsB [Pseudomonas fragi]
MIPIPSAFANVLQPRRALARLACALLAACAGAASASANSTAPVPAAGATSYTVTLKQLGRNYPMSLRGVESTDSVSFDVRADSIVTGARLNLQYTYSPALLAELSQINVLVNDEVAASLALPKDKAGQLQQQMVQIPAHLITEFNRLSLQFIGHYTMSCEDPQHSSLWAKISNASELGIDVSPLVLPDDLAIMPLPFFDRRDARALDLPFVFAAAPDNATLEAAGALSSWFGAQASYRGARFTSAFNQIPASGNAVVLLSGPDALQVGSLSLPPAKGPTLTVMANPNDANGKLLVLSGRDGSELKRAATALVLGNQALSGNSVVIERMEVVQPRKPYDAPNWLPSDRKVKLGELLPAKELSVSGYNPGDIVVPLNFAPDLFTWRDAGAPLHLKYRYTPQERSNNSSLIISFNDALMQSQNLLSQDKLDSGVLSALQSDDSLGRETTLLLPLNSAALQSRLQLRYMFDYLKQGECNDIIIDNMRGGIDPESTLDVSGYDHFIAMPNLGVFKDAGFPFTRLADLSQTAVVLPDNAGTADLAAYLTVLGRFGHATGYPATGVQVLQAAQVASAANKDLLVLASGGNQPLLAQWADQLPASNAEGQLSLHLSDLPMRVRDWLSPDPEANLRRARMAMAFSGGASSTYLTGFESPLKSGRSVVVIASSQPQGLADVTNALIGGEDYTQSIQGSLVVVRGKNIEPLVADEQYYVGSLGPIKYLQWLISRHVVLALVLTGLGLILLSGLAYLLLRARANQRLQGEPEREIDDSKPDA